MLACDKANKGGIPHFVKTLSCWDDIKDEVECFLLDIDGAGSSDQNCADAMDHSMLQKQVGMVLLGIGTDSGGGATLESFCDALSELKLINPKFCFISVCTLHLLQLLLAVPVDHVFGLGGRDKYNAMQLLHSMYDLERFFGHEVGKTMYQEHIEKLGLKLAPQNAMPNPVITHWWWFDIACDIPSKYWDVDHSIAKSCLNAFGSTSYAKLVGSTLDSLMKEEMLQINIKFTTCFASFMIML